MHKFGFMLLMGGEGLRPGAVTITVESQEAVSMARLETCIKWISLLVRHFLREQFPDSGVTLNPPYTSPDNPELEIVPALETTLAQLPVGDIVDQARAFRRELIECWEPSLN